MEGDRVNLATCVSRERFQSTPSAWRETETQKTEQYIKRFQSTPSAWRETIIRYAVACLMANFNPLPPRGGRRPKKNPTTRKLKFQSTPSAWRETVIFHSPLLFYPISIHSLRVEGDLTLMFRCLLRLYFNPLPPRGGRRREAACRVSSSAISIHSLRVEGDGASRI